MSFQTIKLQCKTCETNTSVLWRKCSATNDIICQKCFIQQEASRSDELNGNLKTKPVTKSSKTSNTRLKSARSKVVPKGKNRRNIFKSRSPYRIESTGGTNVTSDHIFYQGQYFQRGDIVSVVDEEDKKTYYAQCNSFITNTYCEKFVSFTWLLPTRKFTPKTPFHPSFYYIGPADDLVHDMQCVQFVCHAPSDYYKPLQSLYPTFPTKLEKNYVSVNMCTN